jgi:deoxyribodipyrimidine photo-lyase
MPKTKINILWFKRDLRVNDHQALNQALKSPYPILAIYIFEPIIESNYDFDIRHWQFVYQSIVQLRKVFPVNCYYGNAIEIFNHLDNQFDIQGIFSHQETGVDITFRRDLHVKKFLEDKKISWSEFQSNGVIRGLKNRKTWDAAWAKYVNTPVNNTQINEDVFMTYSQVFQLSNELTNSLLERNHHAGYKNALQTLDIFLKEKVEDYFSNISFPDKSRYHCSRLSAYISWGNISIREVYQACKKARSNIRNKMSIDQFMARLKWHCHFIQKLEMEPRLEFENLNPSFNGIREKKNKGHIKAWKQGLTGFPLIDAAMRCVNETGYLNFRLRSSVASFLTHLLWQPWQEGARYLARMFLDYEPGIHFPQFQMQAGTTGVNTIRVYNPVKQSLEKDKNANFIKKWVPELAHLPTQFIHEPWKMSPMEEMLHNFDYGKDYPKRIVDHEKAAKYAREKLWQTKKGEENKLHSLKILNKHTRRTKRRKHV